MCQKQKKLTENETTEHFNAYKIEQKEMTNQETTNNKNKSENNLDKILKILNIILCSRRERILKNNYKRLNQRDQLSNLT